MKAIILAGAAALVLAGNAAAETKAIAVTDIASLKVSGRFETDVVQGPRTSAVLEGPADDIARLGIRFERGALRVWEKCTVFCGNRDLDVTLKVTAPMLRAIDAEKGATVRARAITVGAMTLDVAMGANLEIDGRCTTLTADAAMGGGLDAGAFVCGDVEVDAAMGGSATVHATQSLKAEASMGGAISAAGSPARRDVSTMMGGDVSVD